MKIQRLEINNFLRLRRLKVTLKEPIVHLFAGNAPINHWIGPLPATTKCWIRMKRPKFAVPKRM